MDKNETVEILKELPERIAAVIMPSDRFFDYKGALDFAIKTIEADRWIPVSERLPEKWQGVLAYDNNDVFVAWRIDDAWNSSDSQFDKNTPIIAWRPLPEAYKESEATNEQDNHQDT